MALRKTLDAPTRSLLSFSRNQENVARLICSSRYGARTWSSTAVQRSLAPNHNKKGQFPRGQVTYRFGQKQPKVIDAGAKAVEAGPNTVEIVLDGQAHDISAVWLRDLCQCSHCVDPSTRQKHFATVDIPETIRTRTVEYGQERVSITWINDIPGHDAAHTTVIPTQVLRSMLLRGTPVPPERRLTKSLWSAQQFTDDTRDFEYEAYMTDDSVLLAALKQLETHGLLFVKNVPESGESVEALAERIGPLKTTFYGRTWDVRSVPQAKNVAYTSSNLGFHMDLMYMEQPPHLQLLHCIRSSANGGASLFSDSLKAAIQMEEQYTSLFNTLCHVNVTYHYDHVDHQYLRERPVVTRRQFRDAGFHFSSYQHYMTWREEYPLSQDSRVPPLRSADFIGDLAWSPPFQGPFVFKGGLDKAKYRMKSWHDAAQKLNELIHQPDAVYERMMKPGECVIFDNRRVLHARKAFEVGDAGKERWLKGGYIDKDPYMSKLKVLMNELEPLSESSDVLHQSSSLEPEQASVAAA